MSNSSKKKCPACREKKVFRDDQKTCGCIGKRAVGDSVLPVTNESVAAAQLMHFRAKVREQETVIQNLLKDRGKYAELIGDLKRAIPAMDPYPRVLIKPSGVGGKEVAVVVKASDWQIGEVIDPGETEGFGMFNFAVAERRVFKLAEKLIDWADMHRKAGFVINELHIFSEADLVSGNIHYELEVTNEFPLPIAVEKAGYLLAEFTARLAPHFPKVIVWEMSADNHGRLTRKNQAKQGAKNNYSRLAHIIANGRLASHENIEIIMGEGTKLLANVLGKKFLIAHGHHIMGQMGLPFYGMVRDRAREATKRLNTDKTFDYVSMGHWHVPSIIENNILINGNLPGTTEFDHMQGRQSPPSQVSFMVHPQHGLFNWTAWKLD